MILGIDAHNLRAGGGITHLINLLVQKDFCKGFKKIYFFGGKYILAQLEQLQTEDMVNVEILHQPMLDKGLGMRIFWQQFFLPRLLNKLNVDILFSPGGIIPLFLNKKIKTITMCHNMLPINIKETLYLGVDLRLIRFVLLRVIQKISYSRADGVIFISNHAKSEVSKIVPKMTEITKVIYHGINPIFYKYSYNKVKTDRIEIVYVSTIDVYKHQWQVIKALAILRDKGFNNFHLNLIGSGYSPAVKKMNQTIKKYHMESMVTWKGAISYLDLPSEYQKASLFVFASSCENCPNILLEAMAANIPIACSNRDPMTEFANEDTVQFFDPQDKNSIFEAINFLINNPEEAQKKAVNAFEVSKQYRWDECAKDTLHLIEDTFKTSSKVKKTWLIGPLPPPLLGQSLAFAMLCDDVKQNYNFEVLNIGGQNLDRRDGSFSLSRIKSLLSPFLRATVFPFNRKKTIYLTIAQSWVGFLRDSIFIFLGFLGKHKIILHLHGGNYSFFYNSQSSFRQRLIKWMLSKSSKIIVLSDNLIDMFKFLPRYDSKVCVVPNGLPYEEKSIMQGLKKLPVDNSEIKILYLSNLIESKGYLDVLNAVSVLKNKFQINIKASFCGKFLLGSDSVLYSSTEEAKNDFFKRVKDLDLENNVVWKGVVDGDEKTKELRSSHFFVLPTNYNNEGQPLSIIEAMAYGCCVLTTDYRAIPDLIGENKNAGVFVAFNSPEDIARNINDLVNDNERFQQISQNAINRYNTCFTKTAHLNNLKEVILN